MYLRRPLKGKDKDAADEASDVRYKVLADQKEEIVDVDWSFWDMVVDGIHRGDVLGILDACGEAPLEQMADRAGQLLREGVNETTKVLNHVVVR